MVDLVAGQRVLPVDADGGVDDEDPGGIRVGRPGVVVPADLVAPDLRDRLGPVDDDAVLGDVGRLGPLPVTVFPRIFASTLPRTSIPFLL